MARHPVCIGAIITIMHILYVDLWPHTQCPQWGWVDWFGGSACVCLACQQLITAAAHCEAISVLLTFHSNHKRVRYFGTVMCVFITVPVMPDMQSCPLCAVAVCNYIENALLLCLHSMSQLELVLLHFYASNMQILKLQSTLCLYTARIHLHMCRRRAPNMPPAST
jgi:hypothetical protein